MRILVLCTGNSCRSQMAHGFLQSFDRHIEVYSAGTSPAKHVHPIAISVMSEVGIDISHHIPKMVEQYLNEQWDYVITVCGGANETCPTFVGKVGKRIHIGFDDPSNVTYRSFCRLQHARSPDKHGGCGHFNYLEGKIYF